MIDTKSEPARTLPKSIQPGIPRLTKPKAGWRTVKFAELLTPVSRPVKLDDRADYRLVTVKRSRGGIAERGHLKGRQISVKSQFSIEGGDFLISKRQIVHGACAIVPPEFTGAVVSNEYAVLRCQPELDLNFLGHLSHSVYFQQTCFHSSIGVHVEKMIFKLDRWFEWPINLPPLPEQQEIAAFLGSVDSKLDALRRKGEGLERFKTGLMQRLFSRTLRFTRDDGSQFPVWKEKRLGELGKFFKGKGIAKSDILDEGYLPCIRYGELYTLYKERILHIVSRTEVASKGLFLSEMNDVIIPASGETPIDMSRASCVLVEGVALGGDINVFRGSLNGEFLAYLLTHGKRNEIAQMAQGNSVVHLYPAQLTQLVVPVPHPDEQRKIADALSAVDAKIAAVASQIEQMETFKKGLLQQLFV